MIGLGLASAAVSTFGYSAMFGFYALMIGLGLASATVAACRPRALRFYALMIGLGLVSGSEESG